MIVDDYPDALDIWAIYLRSLGYRVSTAGDGAAAIAQAERLLPDLIVLDLELPRVSGFDVAKRLRANPDTQFIPLIAATGYSHLQQLDRAREAGFDQIVDQAVRSRPARRGNRASAAVRRRVRLASPAIWLWSTVTRMGSTLPTGGANDDRYGCA